MGNVTYVEVSCCVCGTSLMRRSHALSQRKDGQIRCASCSYAKRQQPRKVYADGEVLQVSVRARVSKIRLGARRRNIEFALSDKTAAALVLSDCHYCGVNSFELKPVTAKSKHPRSMNGIDRIDSTRGYVEGNVVPCCIRCNTGKNALTIDEFKVHVEKMYRRLCETRWEVLPADKTLGGVA